jgi:hypothetical protein
MIHVVLLGDSIFDNGLYVPGGLAVIDHLRRCLPSLGRATLLARDGAGMTQTDRPFETEIDRQLERVPADATHFVLSVGGNDALDHRGLLLHESARSFAGVLGRLAEIQGDFQKKYRSVLRRVRAIQKPTAVCTIYDARFPEPERQRLAVAALTLFNDVITREAFARGLSLVDLRLICDRDEDYANPIEPSVQGGEKIAAVIAKLAAEHNDVRRRSEVFAW